MSCINSWTRPELLEQQLDNSTPEHRTQFKIVGLRHPMLENFIGSKCVPNDFDSSLGEISIITGPNMGGKSTFMRAIGLCSILAHMGCFVPATSASIPLLDRILTRVGTADSIVRGASTFMIEMQQIVNILDRVTRNSLVIIDELGRGTSTHDGFGIAWAVLESLRAKSCFVLFATHFHELSHMAEELNSGVQNLSVNAHVPENGEEIAMLFEVINAPCNSSYGIEVARVAKFPKSIVDEARLLESNSRT